MDPQTTVLSSRLRWSPCNIESVNTAAACTTLIRGCGMGMETASEGCRLTDFGLESLSRGRKSFIAGVVCLLTAELIRGVFLRSKAIRGCRMWGVVAPYLLK